MFALNALAISEVKMYIVGSVSAECDIGGQVQQARSYAVSSLMIMTWRGVGVAYRAGFENRCAPWGTGGSNPPLSAIFAFCNNGRESEIEIRE